MILHGLTFFEFQYLDMIFLFVYLGYFAILSSSLDLALAWVACSDMLCFS